MRFFAILLVPLLVAAHANPAPGRSRGGSSSSAGSKDCITQSGVSFYAGNTTDISRGIYNSGVNVKLICYLTGQAVNQNTYWDKTCDGHYIPEYAFDTSCAYQLPPC